MTDKTLRKMSRRELMELLLAQSKEVERLRAELEQAEQKLRSNVSFQAVAEQFVLQTITG